MSDLRKIADLPESQQKALFAILRMNKPAVRTTEVHKKIGGGMTTRSVGAVLGSLYRNGYLKKVQGGRDKMWRLTDQAEPSRDAIATQLDEVKEYWS